MIDKGTVLKKAQLYTAKGQIDKAIEEWQKLIQETPNDGNIFNTIGDLYLKKNDITSAVSAYLRAGDVFNDAGFSLKTIAVYKKILKIDPENVDVYLKLGDLNAERGLIGNARDNYLLAAKDYTKKGLTKKALEVYRKIADLDSSNTGIRVKIAELYLKEGLHKEALEEFIKAGEAYTQKGELKEAEEVYEHIIKLDTKNSKVFASLGRLYLTDNRISEAIEILQKAVKDNPDDIGLLRSFTEACNKEGRYEEEEKAFRRLIELEPQDLRHHKGLGYCLLKSGNVDEAFKEFKLLSEGYLNDNDFQGVIQMMKDLLDVDPHHNEAKVILVGIYEKSGKMEEAITIYLSIADSYVHQNQLDKAANIYERVLELDPENRSAKDVLSTLPASISEVEEPISEVSEVKEEAVVTTFLPTTEEDIRERKELIENSFTEADVYLKYGLINKAVEQLETILSLDSNNIQAHTRLKDIYKISGENQKAIAECLILSKLYKETGDKEKREGIIAEALDIEPENEKVKREWVEISGQTDTVTGADAGTEVATDVVADVSLAPTVQVSEELPPPVDLSDEEAIAEAEFYLQQGLVEEAKRIYRRILTLNPDNEEIKKRLSELMDEGKDLPLAVEEDIIALNESVPVQTVEEEPVFQKAAKERETEEKIEEYFDLTKELSKILEEEPLSEEKVIENGLETVSLDVIFKEFQKGIKEQFGDEDYETHYNLGIAYKEMGLLNEAIEEFKLSINGNERFFDSASMLALCLREKGMYHEAIEQLEEAIKDPRFVEKDYIGLKYDLGQLYEDVGEIEKALTVFNEVQNIDANFQNIAKKISDLNKKLIKPIHSAKGEEIKKYHEEEPPKTVRKKGKGRVSYL